MTTTKKRQSQSESRRREQEHLLFLERLEDTDSCCSICHCDCYNSHRSDDKSGKQHSKHKQLQELDRQLREFEKEELNSKAVCQHEEQSTSGAGNHRKSSSKSRKKKTSRRSATPEVSKSAANSPASRRNSIPTKSPQKHRSKSANSQSRRRSPSPAINSFNTRDCKILQDLLNSFDETPRLELRGNQKEDKMSVHSKATKLPPCNLVNSQLCSSMANLCLAPTIRKAYEQIPSHDKKILNRMAHKRSEQALSKENAWLARKYWENERYEREMLKVEQMEEYKQAVKDKQFQDYLITKARLNELAQRDLAELNRLRACVQEKDQRAKKRLETLRVERDILQCQRRSDELRKLDAVTIQQEEQHHEELLNKRAQCQRLGERLQRAHQIRSDMLDGYLRRLRHDNYMQQLLHEEKWLERQADEQLQRENLKQHINHKQHRSKQFVDSRQKRNAILSKNAKISASLRELVRNSVTPEGALLNGVIGGGAAVQNLVIPAALSKLLDRIEHQM